MAAGLVVVAGAGAAWLCGDVGDLVADREPASLLLAAAELAVAALLGRCGLGALLGLAAVALGPGLDAGRVALRVTPGLLRPGLSALLALGVSAAAAGPALAAGPSPQLPAAPWSAADLRVPVTHDGPTPNAAHLSTANLPSAGWVPAAEPAGRVATSARLLTGAAARDRAPDGIVVHRGDTLWAIVARALGPRASDARIAAQWPRWYAANRAAIGPDPDLLQPGTTLHAPPAASR
jgi:hypothetical protein